MQDKSQKLTDNPLLFRSFLIGCAVVIIASIAFSVGSGVGFAIGRMNGGNDAVRAQGAGSAGEAAPDTRQDRNLEQEDLNIFWEAMDLLERDFYGDLPSENDRAYGAIRGVLELLDDPNTSFLTPDQASNFLESMDGSFEGIGATVEWDDEREAVRIVEPFRDQPAWNAGLRRDDLIIAIDGDATADMADLTEAISKIKGPEGTEVVLTVVRGDRTEPFDVEVERDVIQIPIIFAETYGEDDELPYVRLGRFSNDAAGELRSAVDEALEGDPEGLILDLRGNPGGLLREAVNVSSLFMEDNAVVLIERFSDGSEDIYRAEGGRVVPEELPMVVLVDEGSASASEIVAGALQDSGRAVLVGTTTFGKGSVQLPHHLSDGSMMRVTIARWYTPDGRSIDGTGLEPDVVVEISEEELVSEEDPQLDRAIELLESGQ